MGTKSDPSMFDCYSRAAPDEPMFTLLGRDPMAASIVRLWAYWRQTNGEDPARVAEAFQVANAMEEYCEVQGKTVLKLSPQEVGKIHATINLIFGS